jgi:hypothetical protein
MPEFACIKIRDTGDEPLVSLSEKVNFEHLILNFFDKFDQPCEVSVQKSEALFKYPKNDVNDNPNLSMRGDEIYEFLMFYFKHFPVEFTYIKPTPTDLVYTVDPDSVLVYAFNYCPRVFYDFEIEMRQIVHNARIEHRFRDNQQLQYEISRRRQAKNKKTC